MIRNLKKDKDSLEKEAKKNSLLITIQKEVNQAEKWTIKTPYQHPNYKSHFDQRQGQNEHKQGSYDFKCKRTQILQPKQKTGIFIRQNDQQSAPIKVNLGSITS